ncbi:isopentenyl-diphosphate Delta-isomerase [Chryseobacterium defluvii]
MLLQQRYYDKYHSGGLWTNASCSHPAPNETIEAAAQRRLQEEMGFQCPLNKIFEFTYRSELGNGLIEHEYDHVFLGRYEGNMLPNPVEVNDSRYWNITEIADALTNTRRCLPVGSGWHSTR